MRMVTSHRRRLFATLGAVATSGVFWFLLHEVRGRDPGDVLHILPVTHSMAAFVSVIAFGSVLHVPAGWRQRRNQLPGFAVALTFVLLIASAPLF